MELENERGSILGFTTLLAIPNWYRSSDLLVGVSEKVQILLLRTDLVTFIMSTKVQVVFLRTGFVILTMSVSMENRNVMVLIMSVSMEHRNVMVLILVIMFATEGRNCMPITVVGAISPCLLRRYGKVMGLITLDHLFTALIPARCRINVQLLSLVVSLIRLLQSSLFRISWNIAIQELMFYLRKIHVFLFIGHFRLPWCRRALRR